MNYYLKDTITLKLRLGGMLIILILFSACKKDVNHSLPDARKSASVNFYIASDVMNAAYASGHGITAAYIDSITFFGSNINYNSSGPFPSFGFGYTNRPEFPLVDDKSAVNLFTYIRFNADNHRFYFTDVTNTIVADSTQDLQNESWNCFYLADKPQSDGAEAAYTIFSVQEPRSAQEGKTGVRFIHLSPDAGQLECKALLADGLTTGSTLATIRYRQASDYAWLTQEQVSNGVLRVRINNTQVNLTTAVPAKPGRAFVVVIRGFLNNTARRVTTGKNPDGSLSKSNVLISAGLRAEVRTSY